MPFKFNSAISRESITDLRPAKFTDYPGSRIQIDYRTKPAGQRVMVTIINGACRGVDGSLNEVEVQLPTGYTDAKTKLFSLGGRKKLEQWCIDNGLLPSGTAS